ncbi:MAG TPA: sigma-54 dependent transcriptional regulator [Limnobacter sp.]|uniref:sigma-54 dependent transcriptional regulator n=1 Tax=Limnobacter sp. TaxID=2003368 RepID=UPI002EDBA972
MNQLTVCVRSPELRSRLRAAALLMQSELREVRLDDLLSRRQLPGHWIVVDSPLDELVNLIDRLKAEGRDPATQIIRFIDQPWQSYVYHDIPIFASIVVPPDPLSTVQILEKLSKTQPFAQHLAVSGSVDEPSDSNPFHTDFVRSPGMRHAVQQLECLKSLTVDTVLLGPTGAGKDTAARWLHKQSRSSGQFVHVNCAALPENLFEAELFGVSAGAYTGASKDRPGKFELAHQGTLYLDEIDSLSLACQAKLLTALQYRGATRLGGHHYAESDCRVIASTKVDFPALIAAGRFREDLYFRLHVSQVQLPALRDRLEDIIPLYEHFLALFAQRFQRPLPSLTADWVDQLLSHPWPGNVRELQACAQRQVIGLDFPLLDPSLRTNHGSVGLKERVIAFETALIQQSLKRHQGCAKSASVELGLPLHALYYRLRRQDGDVSDSLHTNGTSRPEIPLK